MTTLQGWGGAYAGRHARLSVIIIATLRWVAAASHDTVMNFTRPMHENIERYSTSQGVERADGSSYAYARARCER
jgi:hypothetical protein